MFVHQEASPTIEILGGEFSLLKGSVSGLGETMHTIGLNTAIREIKQALEMASAQNQPQVNILYAGYHVFDDETLQQYHEQVKLVLKRVESEIDLTNIQANYHIKVRHGQAIILTLWIS